MQLLFECLSTVFKHLVEHLVAMLPEVSAASGSVHHQRTPQSLRSSVFMVPTELAHRSAGARVACSGIVISG